MDALQTSKNLRWVWDDTAFILVSRGQRIEPRHSKITCLLLKMTVSHTSAKGSFLYWTLSWQVGRSFCSRQGFFPYNLRTLLTFRKTVGSQKGDVIEEVKLWTPSSFVLYLWTGNVMEFMMQWADGAGGKYSVLRKEICREIRRKRPRGTRINNIKTGQWYRLWLDEIEVY